MNIIEVVDRYLEGNRRLVVPGFGAFVAKESGEVVFSEMLQTDDGVLRALLAAEGLSEMECAAIIDRFVFEVRHELASYGYCRLGNVGTLRRIPESGALRLMPPPPATPTTIPAPAQPKVAAVPPVPQPVVPAEQSSTPPAEQPRRAPRRSAPQKRGVDKFVMAIAVAVLLLAAAAIAYGWYSNRQVNIEQDDMAMDALRIELGASSSQQ